MTPEILFEIKTLKSTADWGFGREILSFIAEFDKRLVPEVFKTSWKREFHDFQSVDGCKDYWASSLTMKTEGGPYFYAEFHEDFIFKRRRVVKSSFEFRHAFTNQKGQPNAGVLTFCAKYHKAIDWNVLFTGLCDILQSHDAMMHYFGKDEARWRFGRGLEYAELAHHTLFPAAHVQEKTRDFCYYMDEDAAQKLSKAGIAIEKRPEGYLVKVSERVEDMIDDYGSFSNRREHIKSLFPKKTLRGWKEHLVFSET